MKFSAHPWHRELLRMKDYQLTLVLGERVRFATLFKPTTRAPTMAPLPFGKRIAVRMRQPTNDFLFFCRQI